MNEKEEIINEIKQTVNNNSQTTENKKPDASKKKSLPKKIILIAIATVIVIIILILLLSGGKRTLSVYVVDELSSPLGGATVTINEQDTQTTDGFGYSEFTNLKSKNINLKASKESYITETKEIKLSNKLQEEEIILRIDTTSAEFKGITSERRREIIFKSYDLVITDNLNVTFKCSNNTQTPEPRTTTTTTGRTNVLQPRNCGSLLVSVTSNNYEIVTDRNIPESNIVELTRVNTNTGMLEITVRDLRGQAIPYANLRLYNVDNPQTPVNESEIIFSTGITDVYGKYKFNVAQGSYLLSIDKTDYISLPRLGPHAIVNNNLTTVNITLLTAADLSNIDCSNAAYAPFCKNGSIDCNSPLLTGLVTPNPNGTGCTIGRLTNLTVKLKDQNTSVPVTGNISIYKRDNNVSTLIITRRDINQTTFILNAYNNYRVVVSNTEDSGYFPAPPLDVNNLADTNTTIEIPLEFLSSLNSGSINVNVSKDGYDRANALVYLFYEYDDEYVLYNPENPKTTNSNGDTNFNLVKSNRDYYAYAILRNESADGDSLPAEELDSNDTLELAVVLHNQSKTLNLKITPNQDYNVSFFDVSGDEINSASIISTTTTADTNKTYVFNCGDGCSRVYMMIAKEDIIYQTDLISLFPGQVAYKEITFPATLSQIQTTTSYLGLFDETGTNKIDSLSFSGNNDLTKEYKLKFKTVFGSKQETLKKATIRAGKYLTENADYIYITNNNLFVPEDTEINTGCRYRGDLDSWDSNYFSVYYNSDYSTNNCIAGKYKWVEFDFSEINANIIEYSVNIKFRNEITTIDNYKVFYKSINSDLDTFAFSPSFTNWNDWSIRPEGYFYAPTQVQAIPFDNSNFSYVINLYEGNTELTKFGSDYILYIGKDYNYSLKFIQFSDTNKTGSIITDTQNTNNNYIFTNSYFKDKTNQIPTIQEIDNNASVTIPNKTTNIGYYFINYLIGKPNGFFSLDAQPTLRTQLFKNNSSTLATATTNILSYSDSNYVPIVKSNSADGNIYVGSNDLNISLKNRTGNFENDIIVKYLISGDTIPTELGQINNNTLNTEIFIPLIDSGKTITFTFTIPNSNLPNNELTWSQIIGTGIGIYDLNNQLITSNNKLKYAILLTNIDGKKKVSSSIKDYIIKNNTNRHTSLDSITISDNEAFLEEAINDNLKTINAIPKDLNQTNIIATELLLDSNINQTDINFNYNNIFTIENIGDLPTITLCKDTNASATIKTLGITDSSRFTSTNINGYYEDENGAGIELITGVVSNLSIGYDLNLLFTNLVDYNILETEIVGDNISNYINFTETHTKNLSSNRLTGSFDFTFILKNINFSEIIEKDANINIKIGNQAESFVYEILIKITLYPKNKSYSLTSQGNNYLTIACKEQNDCNSTKPYYIENKTKSYDLKLTDLQVPNPSPLTITPQTTIPLDIHQNEIPVTVDGNFSYISNSLELLETLNKQIDLVFNLNINNTSIVETTQLTVKITNFPPNPGDKITSLGLTGNFCLGVGGQVQNNNYFILGVCDTGEQEACVSGEAALPKVSYDWREVDNWETLCIDSNEQYDTNKTHCDSVQALYSIFTLISNPNYDSDKNNYIYLMYDGFSEDLLDDFRAHYDEFLVHNISDSFSDNYLDIGYNKEISLAKTTPIGAETNEVGKYKIVVSNLNKSFTSDINITLELVQNIPLNKNNLFYYLPLDGDFGLQKNTNTVHRIGYGSGIVGNYDYDDVFISESQQQSIKLYKASSNSVLITKINARNPTSYLVNWQIEDVLESDGTLLDLTVDNTGNTNQKNINFNFTASKPIQVFAKVSGIATKDFSYKLMVNDQFPISVNNLFKWKEFNVDNYSSAIADNAVFGPYYLRHTITAESFIGQQLQNNYLLESKIYLPVNVDYDDLTLSLIDLDNNESSRIYTFNNLDGTKETPLKSRVSNIYSINDLLNQVKDGNACISNTLSSTKISWVENKTDVPKVNRNVISGNYSNPLE